MAAVVRMSRAVARVGTIAAAPRMGCSGAYSIAPLTPAFSRFQAPSSMWSSRFQMRSFCDQPENPSDRKYAASHEWLKVEDGVGTVGITKHAADALGEIVFVDLPEVGSDVSSSESFGAIESVKAASDVYAPVSGEVVEVNAALADAPETVNKDAFGEGWMIRVKLSDSSEADKLLNSEDYTKSYEDE